jgi:hypothetical protein
VLRDAYGLRPAIAPVENVWPGGDAARRARCGRGACAGGWCKEARA